MRPTSDARPSTMPLKAAPARPSSSSPVSARDRQVAVGAGLGHRDDALERAPHAADDAAGDEGGGHDAGEARARTPMMVPSRAVSSALAMSSLRSWSMRLWIFSVASYSVPTRASTLRQPGDDLARGCRARRPGRTRSRASASWISSRCSGLGEDRLDLLVADRLDDRVRLVADGVGAVEVLERLLVAASRRSCACALRSSSADCTRLARGVGRVDPLLRCRFHVDCERADMHQRRPIANTKTATTSPKPAVSRRPIVQRAVAASQTAHVAAPSPG